MSDSANTVPRNFPFTDAMAYFADAFANWDTPRTVCLTFDQDWAPEFMLAHVLDILDEFAATATFLATSASDQLMRRAPKAGHEVGIHPNLAANSTQGRDLDEIIRGLRAIYPAAAGSRFHVLGHSYRDLMTLGQAGFTYDVSTFRLNCPYLLPSWHDDLQMALLTYCWEDGYTVDGTLSGSTACIELDSPGMKIINFHPLNVFLNCAHADQKAAFQRSVPDLGACARSDVLPYRRDGDGIEKALRELLSILRARGIQTVTLQQLSMEFRRAQIG